MAVRHEKVSIVTDSGGAGTGFINARGYLNALHFALATPATTGVDITVAKPAETAKGLLAETVLTLTDAGTADLIKYPRHAVHGGTGTALTATAGGDNEKFQVNGRLEFTIAQGGATKTYVIGVEWDDEQ